MMSLIFENMDLLGDLSNFFIPNKVNIQAYPADV